MKKYKGIHINKLLLKDTISNFSPKTELTVEESKKFKKLRISMPDDEVECTICYYENNNGTVSFSNHECKNKSKSIEIMNHVIDNIKVDAKYGAPVYIKDFTEQNYKELIEYVTKEYEAKVEKEINRVNGFTTVLKSQNGETCNLNYFNNRAFNIQGPNAMLKCHVFEGLSHYLPFNDIVTASLERYKIEDVNQTEAEKLFDARLPNASKYLDVTVKNILFPAILTEKIDIETTDYTFMTFPAYRALEGFMKQILLNEGITVRMFSEIMKQKKGINNNYELTTDTKKNISCIYKIRVVELCYEHLRSTRHTLFHVDGTLIGTNIIETKEAAASLIADVFNLIEKCVNCIQQKDFKYLS